MKRGRPCVLTILLVASLLGSASGCSKKKDPSEALIEAAKAGNASECARLVKSGAAVDAPDAEGVTALGWAVFNCKPATVHALLELGADANHRDHRGGFTPLMYTGTPLRGHRLYGSQVDRIAIAQQLIQRGADVNQTVGDGHTSGDGQTALHFAAKSKSAGLVKILLASGARRDAKDTHGLTPLDVAKFPDYAPNDKVIDLLSTP